MGRWRQDGKMGRGGMEWGGMGLGGAKRGGAEWAGGGAGRRAAAWITAGLRLVGVGGVEWDRRYYLEKN